MRDSLPFSFLFKFLFCCFVCKFNNLDFIFYLGLSDLNYAEIAFRQDNELECLKNYLSLEKPAQEVESSVWMQNL